RAQSALSSLTATEPASSCTLSLHDALPISTHRPLSCLGASAIAGPASAAQAINRINDLELFMISPNGCAARCACEMPACPSATPDRKSTRLHSSHVKSSYAVFCLKKKKTPP